jgi:hypothetical protein
MTNSPVLILDLSDFETDKGIARAFLVWRREIEEDPQLWVKGWSIERWKAHTAAKLDRYGRKIIAAINLVPWLESSAVRPVEGPTTTPS